MMANRKKSNESSQSTSKNVRRHVGETMFLSSSSSEEEVTTGCRSCRNTSKEHFTMNRVEADQRTGQDAPKREENPFSFKHFLKNGAQTNYQNTGARPKIYSSPTLSPNSREKDPGVYSCNPTELPDFVQDHLVIEQCYLNHESNQQAIPDVDNLPDFALNSVEQRQARLRNELKKGESNTLRDLSLDLTGIIDKGLPHRSHSIPSTIRCPNLDLPTFDGANVESIKRPESSGFPLDLPMSLAESNPISEVAARDCPVTSEASVPKSLPDFLNDGPIHNRTTSPTDPGSSVNTAESTERRLLLTNERLRCELQQARKEIFEKTKRIQLLESKLSSRKEVDDEETAHLEKAMEQVEDNLKRSTRRAVNAESTVTSLKQEIKSLTAEISLLRLENLELRTGMATGNLDKYGSSSECKVVRRLASELRTAASTAEMSLRQLMTGVDNLRVIASTLENVDRIEDRTKDFVADFDEDNAAGPAL